MEEASKNFSPRLLLGITIFGLLGGLFLLYVGPKPTARLLLSPVILGSASRGPGLSPFAALLEKPLASLQDLGAVLGLTESSLPPVVDTKSVNNQTARPQTTSSSGEKPDGVQSGNLTTTNTSASSTPSTANDSTTTTAPSITSSSSPTLTGVQQAVQDRSNLIVSYLWGGNFEALYNLMSSDFKNTFSLDDFKSSFAQSAKVIGGQTTGLPKIYGTDNEWAEQSVKLNLADGSTQSYLNVYHLEGVENKASWTLFGTQDQ